MTNRHHPRPLRPRFRRLAPPPPWWYRLAAWAIDALTPELPP